MGNARLDEAQAGSKIAERNLRYAEDTTLTAESKEELKSLLMKGESEKAGLKLNIQKTKIMASSPITSWQISMGYSPPGSLAMGFSRQEYRSVLPFPLQGISLT